MSIWCDHKSGSSRTLALLTKTIYSAPESQGRHLTTRLKYGKSGKTVWPPWDAVPNVVWPLAVAAIQEEPFQIMDVFPNGLLVRQIETANKRGASIRGRIRWYCFSVEFTQMNRVVRSLYLAEGDTRRCSHADVPRYIAGAE